jgi:acetyl esterase/lipase
MVFTEHCYGEDEPNQYVRIHLPAEEQSASPSKHPVAMIIHGGFWKEKYRIDNSAINLTPFFLEKGFAVCEVEYRRGEAGRWPNANNDIVAALDLLVQLTNTNDTYAKRLDLSNVTLVGHSAGGTLALWACCQGGREGLTTRLCVAIAR